MKYFPKDLNLVIINYLSDDRESCILLLKLEIKLEYYTSKVYHKFKDIFKAMYKIDKVIIHDSGQLNKIGKLNTNLTAPKFKKMNTILEKIKEIKFDDHFNNSLRNACFPKNITHLEFGRYFNQNVNNMPNTITHLTFGHNFNQTINKFPDKVKHLTFGYKFDDPVDNLPNTITYLIFGHCFNQTVNNLPKELKYLIFGTWFNQTVNNLPKGLKYLKFGDDFDQEINNLPLGIVRLEFGLCFNQEINNLPLGIVHLKLGHNFNRKTDLIKYNKLKTIQLREPIQKSLFYNIPVGCNINICSFKTL